MSAKETERTFLSRLSECLVSLPFDLKILQEAISDPDLDHAAREVAAGAVMYALSPQEGEAGPLRFADDALLVRAAFREIARRGGEGAGGFRDRFAEVYDRLEEDIEVFAAILGDVWEWLAGKVATFPKQVYKGKRTAQYVDDEQATAFLYEEGLEFQTNYNVTEEQVRNKLRRSDQVIELLRRRRTEEAKKIG